MRAVSTVTRPAGGSTLVGGTIMLSQLLALLRVPLGQTRAPLEHLGRLHEDLEHAFWVRL